MDKYLVKTGALRGFNYNDVIERKNRHQYGLEDSVAGNRCITVETIKNNPDWFYRVEKQTDLAKEMIDQWDRGESIWSIEMGGVGPGYEQAIQVAMVEIVRAMLDIQPTSDQENDWAILRAKSADVIDELDEKWGYSGAQVGAARNIAFKFWRHGPQVVLKDEQVQDRKIQVNNHLKFA